ncbi:hypothetical protein [Paenibacillus andongensis]|uniref:hypothetical protein n=1 Tax=Paenibacillus andongensis TaxID=2975482 RepID=UPI0021BAEEDF|nr:hypothetical protein [Paenibacillus andongensis]
MSPELIYNQFSELDPASKLFFTLFFGLVIFLYKTFFSMFSEEDKQFQPLKFKTGELLGKLESAIIIYENSQKDRSAKDKLIEKFGECYVYFSWELKKKS